MAEPLAVLIIEDDPLMARALQARLTNIVPGCSVDLADCADGADARLNGRHYDVCMVDLFLDGQLTGLDLIERYQGRFPETAFIVMTAHSRNELAAQAMRMGACDFLIKGSFTDFELETSIRFSCYRKQKEAQVYRLATRDPLTGLANRSLFLDRLVNALARRRRSGDAAAILYIDIDGFKPVNDTHGHAAGDAVLCGIAERLTGHVRATDTVARLGGDEFAVLLESPASLAAAVKVAEGIVAALREPFSHQGTEIRVGASIGVAAAPQDGEDPDRLIAAADDRMYRAKRAGGGVVAE